MSEYTRRQLRDITRLALQRLASGAGLVAPTGDVRDKARAALAQLNHETSAEPRETIWRMQVQPHLWVVVEDSTNVLLEVRGGLNDGELIARTEPVNKAELDSALVVAYTHAEQAREADEDERMRHLREVEHQRARERRQQLPNPIPAPAEGTD